MVPVDPKLCNKTTGHDSSDSGHSSSGAGLIGGHRALPICGLISTAMEPSEGH